MGKITLSRLTSLTNEESAIQALNQWAETLEDLSTLILSRNGQTPNTMLADLDMNSFRILNVPAPEDDNDLVRLVDVAEGVRGEQGPPGEPGGALADGDYGDIVVSSNGAVLSFDTGVVTAAAKTLLDDPDYGTMRLTLQLGDASVKNAGTTAGTVAAGDDSRFYAYNIVTQNAALTFPVIAGPTLYRHTNATTYTYTINPESSTSYPTGTAYVIHNAPGAADITLARGLGVALYINGSTTSADGTISAGATINLINVAADTWLAIGPGIA